MPYVFISLLCVFLWITPSFAKDFTLFSMDVPQTWQEKHADDTTIFSAPHGACSIHVTVAAHQDMTLQALGIVFYESLQGQTPKADDDGLTFHIKTGNNATSIARLTLHGENFALVATVGSCAELQNTLATLHIKGQTTRAFPLLSLPPKAQ